MPDETLEDAIFRLDAAVTRAEAAFVRRASVPVAPPVVPSMPDDPDLPARHARLRAGAEAAIARIDALIDAKAS
ncbi:hypothetical protein [Sphingomonas montana]|uniref:hypothetical protein n=1 Tax=Sphingomonas montana TaxID=1843236 RepID=UPI00096E718F|nr:hypothetical protein [Sphingomonas montana]